MRSTCPDCLSQVEHPHGEPQVVCTSCGSTYSPFLAPGDSPDPSENLGSVDFSESASAFQEIVDFGHNLDQSAPPSKPTVAAVAPAAASKPKLAPSESIPDSFIFTTTDLGPHYQILHWFSPIIRMVLLEDDASPLERNLKTFQEIAQSLGANALTGIRCSLAPDNKRALLMGTPVKREKRQSPVL